MNDETNRGIVDAWGEAGLRGDHDTLRRLAHPEYTLDWPQTAERIRGIDAAVAIDQRYPGGLPSGQLQRVSGSEDRWMIDGMSMPRRIAGAGDLWSAEMRIRYSSGEIWYMVSIIELREHRVYLETQYFAPLIDAPAWREGMTERLPERSER